jgi:hypothetical protein
MKAKHNKKRNTAFLFEVITRHLAQSILEKNSIAKEASLGILREHFSRTKPLGQELECYNALVSSTEGDKLLAEKMIYSVKMLHKKLNLKKVYEEQTMVIHKVNKSLGPQVFSSFVPNYRNYASIAQLFSDNTPVRSRVLLEQSILEKMTQKAEEEKKEIEPIDSLVLKTFISNYNKKYESLLPEQKDLLNKYITSFGDNKVDFQVTLVEELQRIHGEVKKSLTLTEVEQDPDMIESTNKVLTKIEAFDVTSINEEEIKKLLKMQQLVKEYYSDAT